MNLPPGALAALCLLLLASLLPAPTIAAAPAVVASVDCPAGAGQEMQVLVENTSSGDLVITLARPLRPGAGAEGWEMDPLVLPPGQDGDIEIEDPGSTPVSGALVVTNLGVLTPSCSEADELVAGRTGRTAQERAAELTMSTVAELEQLRAYDGLWALMHPDARVETSYGAMACWYDGYLGTGDVGTVAVEDVAIRPWTWGVTAPPTRTPRRSPTPRPSTGWGAAAPNTWSSTTASGGGSWGTTGRGSPRCPRPARCSAPPFPWRTRAPADDGAAGGPGGAGGCGSDWYAATEARIARVQEIRAEVQTVFDELHPYYAMAQVNAYVAELNGMLGEMFAAGAPSRRTPPPRRSTTPSSARSARSPRRSRVRRPVAGGPRRRRERPDHRLPAPGRGHAPVWDIRRHLLRANQGPVDRLQPHRGEVSKGSLGPLLRAPRRLGCEDVPWVFLSASA